MRRDWPIIVLLATVTVAVFWRVSRHEFVNYDDYAYVTLNPIVEQGLTWPGVAWAFGQLHGEATYWHPLTWLSHMLDCQLFGLRPAGHHLGNLFFHTLNTVLLFVLLQRMTGRRGPSAVVAALFALHPLQVDSVAWVAERKNVLSTLFWILTLLAYVRYAARPGWARYLPVFVLMDLGLMAEGQQSAEAIQYYREALRLDPNFLPALNNLAWLRATCPQAELRDGREAVQLAERACQLSRRRVTSFLGALAAAYAEAGRFSDAVKTIQEAQALAQASGATNLLPVHAQMLARFQAGKPFHERPP